MIYHSSHSRLRTTAAALALVLGSALLLSGQDAKKRGLPKDWSMHHLVFSKPGPSVPAARLHKILNDPRYILQQELRAAMAAPPSLPAPLAALKNGPEPDISTAPYTGGPLPRGLTKARIPPTGKEAVPTTAPKRRIHKDWSVSEGSNGTTGVGQFPATFTQTASPCGTDLAIYNTGLTGSSSQATVVAYNNIYATCNGGVPTVYYAYNTGAAVATSVDLAYDGGQIAFIQDTGTVASLVVVRTSNSGGTVATPTTPTSVASTSYNGCTAPCMTTIAFGDSHNDNYSSPFYDYSSDTMYVGDDSGVLHKFTGVFGETVGAGGVITHTGANPAETTTGGWPVQVSSATTGGALGSPVYDNVTGLVFVGDYLLNYASTCEPSATNSAGSCGYLYSIASPGTPTVTKSGQLDYQYGIVDSPVVDETTTFAYVFVGADNTTACSSGPCAGVIEQYEIFGGGSLGQEVQVGAGYEFLLSGTFDNAYYTTYTGNMYVVGGTGPQNNTLYQIPLNGNTATFGPTANKGPAVAANYTNGYYAGGLQVTEFYTGTNDYIFVGALMATTNPLVGLVSGFDVTSGTITTSTPVTGSILAQGGPSGVVVDNSLSTAQNIYYSTTLNSTCTTSGTGGCAVQVIQSAP